MSETDIFLLRLIHHHRLTFLDGFMYWVSFLNTFFSLTLLAVVLGLGFWKRARPLKLRGLILGMGLLSSMVLTLLLKTLFNRPRPFLSYPDITQLSEAGYFSFPSGHTLEAVLMATLMWHLFPKGPVRWISLAWAIMVGYSRMALGVHYPGDVLGGLVAGVLSAKALLYITRRWQG